MRYDLSSGRFIESCQTDRESARRTQQCDDVRTP
jgi:hypothetical protein